MTLAVVAGCASSRQAPPAAIPVPLASALLGDRGSPATPPPNFSIGQLPSGYPTALTPAAPATVVGGMTTGDETVAVFADSTRRLAAVMEELFEQHGFMRPPATPGSGFSPGYGPYSSFCSDSGSVSVEPLTGSNRRLARVTYRRALRGGGCLGYRAARSADQLTLPELKPPDGVHVAGSHGGSGTGEVSSAADVTGANLRASTIVAQYAAQLVAAGWIADPPAVSQRVTAQYFEAKDASGGRWAGVLMASGGGSALAISLIMHPRVNP